MRARRLLSAAAVAASLLSAAPAALAADGDCHAIARAGRLAVATIYFDTGQSTVQRQYDEELRRLAYDAKYQIKVCLIGQADHQGNAEFNKRLSLKRAQAVADVLHHYGVSRSVLVPIAVGEAYGTMGGNRKESQDRRVEVHFPRRWE